MFYSFTPTWVIFPIWHKLFFRWVETTNEWYFKFGNSKRQEVLILPSSIEPFFFGGKKDGTKQTIHGRNNKIRTVLPGGPWADRYKCYEWGYTPSYPIKKPLKGVVFTPIITSRGPHLSNKSLLQPHFFWLRGQVKMYLLPRKLTCALKTSGWSTTFLLTWLIFTGKASFRVVYNEMSKIDIQKYPPPIFGLIAYRSVLQNTQTKNKHSTPQPYGSSEKQTHTHTHCWGVFFLGSKHVFA